MLQLHKFRTKIAVGTAYAASRCQVLINEEERILFHSTREPESFSNRKCYLYLPESRMKDVSTLLRLDDFCWALLDHVHNLCVIPNIFYLRLGVTFALLFGVDLDDDFFTCFETIILEIFIFSLVASTS